MAIQVFHLFRPHNGGSIPPLATTVLSNTIHQKTPQFAGFFVWLGATYSYAPRHPLASLRRSVPGCARFRALIAQAVTPEVARNDRSILFRIEDGNHARTPLTPNSGWRRCVAGMTNRIALSPRSRARIRQVARYGTQSSRTTCPNFQIARWHHAG